MSVVSEADLAEGRIGRWKGGERDRGVRVKMQEEEWMNGVGRMCGGLREGKPAALLRQF
jgi:hypothetical protein